MRYIGRRSARRPSYPLYDYGALTDPAAVEANRNGALTLDQRAVLQKPLRRIGFFSITIIALSGLAIFGLMIALTLIPFHLGPLYSGPAGVSAWDIVKGVAKSACSLPIAVMGLAMLFAAVASPIQAARSRRMTRLDLEVGQIAQSEGEVLRRWYGYMVTVTNGFRGWKAESRNVPLPPGRYRFYLLPRSGRLLSAEPLRPLGAIPGDPREDPTIRLPDSAPKAGEHARALTPAEGSALLGALASANRFSMEELELNRQGRMSLRQQGRQRGIMAAYLVAVVAALVIAIPVVLAFAGLMRAFRLNDPLTVTITVLTVVAVGGVVTISALRSALRHRRDATEQRAQAVEGFVTRESDSVGDSIAYYYVINGMRLAVTSSGYVALIEGLPYRVYYSPRSMMVLSIEPLRPLARAPW